MSKWQTKILLPVVLSAIVLGGLSGWWLARGKQVQVDRGHLEEKNKVEIGKIYGRQDTVFSDTAIGILEKNGKEGEGTHRLLREGGESQTAYLTSSVLDLDLFVGHKVQVWGQTYSSDKVGWLLDVGQIKVLE